MPTEVYKKGQGVAARVCAMTGIGLLALFGWSTLYQAFNRTGTWWANVVWTVPGVNWEMTNGWWICALLFFASIAALWIWLFNNPRPADFLIETEGELKKVSWPTQREWINASMVVIVCVAALGAYLYLADRLLSWGLTALGIGI
jgi:preprotein translocase SecE subunit